MSDQMWVQIGQTIMWEWISKAFKFTDSLVWAYIYAKNPIIRNQEYQKNLVPKGIFVYKIIFLNFLIIQMSDEDEWWIGKLG